MSLRVTETCVVILLAVLALGVHTLPAQETTGALTKAFTDPTRPGALKVVHRGGSLTIVGTSRKDVLIETDEQIAGLRRLTPVSGIAVTETNNDMTITSSPRSAARNVRIQVPSRTNLNVSMWTGGPISIELVDGEIEVHNQGQSITLADVAGSVVAYAHDGMLKATLTRVTPRKALAFSAFNGDVDITLPASTRAMVKMRTDKDIWTDFALQASVTARFGRERSIEGAINGGGPPLEVRTFNGNIYLRKGPQ